MTMSVEDNFKNGTVPSFFIAINDPDGEVLSVLWTQEKFIVETESECARPDIC